VKTVVLELEHEGKYTKMPVVIVTEIATIYSDTAQWLFGQ
jgi:hypothetical protein